LLNESQQRNFLKWPVLGRYVWPNLFVGQTFRSEVEWLKNWITLRTGWLDTNFPKFDPTAVDEAGTALRAFPNPANELLWLQWDEAAGASAEVLVYDRVGRLVRELRVTIDQPVALDIKDLRPGWYLFQVRSQGRTATGKFIIQR
jgi:hypothetical protein